MRLNGTQILPVATHLTSHSSPSRCLHILALFSGPLTIGRSSPTPSVYAFGSRLWIKISLARRHAWLRQKHTILHEGLLPLIQYGSTMEAS